MLSFLPYALVNVCTKSGVPWRPLAVLSGLGLECAPQAALVHPPEVVLNAVDEGDWDHLSKFPEVLF